jgi:molybdopterin converting factor subunit 1
MKVLAFGIIKEIFNDAEASIAIKNGDRVNLLKNILEERYPRLKELGSYMIAVNNEYASADDIIHDNDEVAIIPPVSGG